jgi:para-aminobenzoate synthetase component 1
MYIEPLNGITPLEAFRALRELPYPFILSGGTNPAMRRYTYISAAPLLHISTKGSQTTTTLSSQSILYNDPFQAVSDAIEEFKVKPHRYFPFQGGIVGYLSYDLKSFAEDIPYRVSDIDIPGCFLGMYDPIFVYDHIKELGYIVSTGIKNNTMDKREFRNILSRHSLKKRLYAEDIPKPTSFSSNMTREEYIEIIRKAHEYIAAGDIYQVNISQRLSMEWDGDPFSIYLKLLSSSPAPFSAFMDLGSFQVVCNSPERFLGINGRYIETCPIKGTRPRGTATEEDLLLKDALRNDQKELAEHIMIVDLERNDLGRICEIGTISVKELMSIKTFPNLHHMVSTVRGRLKNDIKPADSIKACFPGGSVTGAPKIRAMEIIDELEPTPRGIYTGALGYIDLSGDMDLAITIRTAIFKDNRLFLHVGGGIVSDSKAASEYDETLLKADSFLKTLITDSMPCANSL